MTQTLAAALATHRRSAAGRLAIAGLLALASPDWAQAQAAAPIGPVVVAQAASPSGVVNLSAAATVHVPRDWISITFSTTREGTDAQAVQSQLKQAVDAARAQVPTWRTAESGQAQTGAFSLQPRYGSKGSMTGWTGTATLTVQGTDLVGISQLVGRISTLTVAHVETGLAPASREKAEADATAQAVARFRAQATTAATLFGYARYELREVAVQGEGSRPPRPVLMRAAAAPMADGGALPVEAGDEDVVMTVTGSVQLLR